jgi:general secretion pathway protein K
MKARRIQSPCSQRGTAVIIALLVLALAAAAATAMLEAQDLQTRGLQAQRDYEQARWMLRGGMHWARSILEADARGSTTDNQRELWASGLPPTDVQLGSLAGEIRDAQGLFNLNNIVRSGKPDPHGVEILQRLLATIGLSPQLAGTIAGVIAATGPLADIGELAGVRGLDAGALGRLQLYAVVLPRPTPVNVNTAPAEVLAAVVEGLDLPQAQAFARRLATQPVRTPSEFQAGLGPTHRLDMNDISAASQFFFVQGRAKVGGADLRMQALLQRAGPKLPSIVWQRTS